MAMAVNVEILGKEIIKPSSPTPIHFKDFKLSFLDQLAPVCYGPLLFFYSINGHTKLNPTISEISHSLKTSLSETLTKFYPLAGRIKDDTSIECNDDGVVFVDAKVNSDISVFLQKPDVEIISKLIPVEIESIEAKTGSLLQVQATGFGCGGFAIGLCFSQKISDAITATTFIKKWTGTQSNQAMLVKQDISRNSIGTFNNQFVARKRRTDQMLNETVLPLFNAASIFPPQNFSFIPPPSNKLKNKEVYVTKRFVFASSKITALKAKCASQNVRNLTRVEAVTGLIWKCAMNASRSNKDHTRLSIISQSVNIRKRMVPPLPDEAIGNLVGHFVSQATESEIELGSLVDQLRKGLKNLEENYVKKLTGKDAVTSITESFREAGFMLEEGNIDFYIFTSLCKIPFYGLDFGWGKPFWVTIPSGGIKNLVVMIDSKDGEGIEAWITLTEEDMGFFECDQELLDVASLNPGVCCYNQILPKSSL